jgi:putative ABC transport system permease protein
MTKLFGIPVNELLLVLVITLALSLGTLLLIGARNRVFLRLGVRNVARRPGRSALIVAGSMLGTAIIAAALATGDTMSQTIRSTAITALGQTDEVVAAQGVGDALTTGSDATDSRYFPEQYADRVAAVLASKHLALGVAPVISESIAVQDVTTRQNEPRVTLFASDPARLRPFGEMTSEGKTVALGDLSAGEVYLNEKASEKLDARSGDTIRLLVGGSVATATVRAIVRYEGGGTADAGLLMPLESAQQLLGKPGRIKAIFVANTDGVGATDEVIGALHPTLAPLRLEADNAKQDALDFADKQGSAFMSMFTTFGSFSIAAGILLIFLIFVMLAAERRGELGIARAVGTRRGHLIQMFVFEGIAYDVVAAAVGALIGIAVAYGMVLMLAGAFASTSDVTVRYSVRPESVVIAYAIGVLLTLAVVVFSAWRVSRMNIVTAIRNLPEPPAERRGKRRWLLGFTGLACGAFIAYSGVQGRNEITLGFGVLLLVFGALGIARALGLGQRIAYTAAGLSLVVWFVLPCARWLFGDMSTNFSIFVLGGLAIVVGASWTLMYNADILLGGVNATAGRNRRLAPVLKMSMAYPLRSLFRTGVTLAMFTLVVFTLVTGAVTTGSFVSGANDLDRFGGGFHVTATTSAAAPITDMHAALAGVRGLGPADVQLVASQSVLPVKAHQAGVSAPPESYLVHGVDRAFLDQTTYGFAATARGYASPRAVWQALAEHPNLAIVDGMIAPRRAAFVFATTSKFRLRGFYIEDKTFAPVPVDVLDPQTGKRVRLTVIGVLADTAPLSMAGIWTSQASLVAAFGDRVLPTTHLLALRPGVDADAVASDLESAFLANGMEADSLKSLLDEAVSASLTFDRIIMGFMGLGLVVGVAALGVISARSVVERRQQIGVLRAIGFRQRMVQLAFLLESSFIAVTSIIVGTGLGLAVAYSVIDNSRRQPSWAGMPFAVPWITLAVIFAAVFLVAMATTFIPARRASRVYPAEALRYQ